MRFSITRRRRRASASATSGRSSRGCSRTTSTSSSPSRSSAAGSTAATGWWRSGYRARFQWGRSRARARSPRSRPRRSGTGSRPWLRTGRPRTAGTPRTSFSTGDTLRGGSPQGPSCGRTESSRACSSRGRRSVVDRLRDRTSRQRSRVRQRVARADRGHEEVARVADVEHEYDYERVAGEVARGRGTAAVVEEHERPEDDGMEVVERVEEREDVRQERRRDLLERHRGIRSEQRAIERNQRGVIVDRVHGVDERAEPVEDHDDAADDVVVEEDGEGASGVGPPRAPGGDPDWHEGNSGHPREDRAVLEGAETQEADEEELSLI